MLRPITAGSEVVEDYGHVGLTLRSHPVSFFRGDLRRQRVVTCADAMQARDGRWLLTAGPVLVRQMPGSAKGVMFITIEDETGIANLVIWPKLEWSVDKRNLHNEITLRSRKFRFDCSFKKYLYSNS
jgi:DNA polymerase III alpha subunit